MDSLAGDHSGAERHLLTAKQAFIEIGDHLFLSTVLVDLARAIYDQGRYEDARALTEEMDHWPAPADTEWQIKRRIVRALLFARAGEGREASELVTEAVGIAAESEFASCTATDSWPSPTFTPSAAASRMRSPLPGRPRRSTERRATSWARRQPASGWKRSTA